MKNIFIAGGAGYCGCILVPKLLTLGYKVKVFDNLYFTDNFLPKNNNNLTIVKGDIRDDQRFMKKQKASMLLLI